VNKPEKFVPGRIVATPGVLAAFMEAGDDPLPYLIRHVSGDWGEVNAEDWRANEESLLLGERLLSAYRMSNGTRFWVITERDHSVTTFLLPEEY
jgi:hypothetical protein